MRLHFVDMGERMCSCWREAFEDAADVSVHASEFKAFMRAHPEIDCAVSPGNSYGLMDGGLDLAISEHFGWGLQDAVQQEILERYGGEQPVGTCLVVPAAPGVALAHVPTMRVPGPMPDPETVYWCMRAAIGGARENGCAEVVVPAFGAGTGGVAPELVAHLMRLAYDKECERPCVLDWDYALRWMLGNAEAVEGL